MQTIEPQRKTPAIQVDYDWVQVNDGRDQRITIVTMEQPGQPPVQGYARCAPSDRDVKAIGIKTAFKDCIRTFTRNERAGLWKQLFTQYPKCKTVSSGH